MKPLHGGSRAEWTLHGRAVVQVPRQQLLVVFARLPMGDPVLAGRQVDDRGRDRLVLGPTTDRSRSGGCRRSRMAEVIRQSLADQRARPRLARPRERALDALGAVERVGREGHKRRWGNDLRHIELETFGAGLAHVDRHQPGLR
jgi:hypothetical protein